jgi:hypothetical protein
VEEPLEVHEFAKSTILPLKRLQQTKSFRAGVLDAQDEPVAASLLYRKRRGIEKQIILAGQPPAQRECVAGPAIYAGPLFSHFGHFLLESLARVWYAASRPDTPLVWSIDGIEQEPQYRSWQAEVLALLGVRNPTLFITKATVFDNVFVPEPGYQIQNDFHPQHRDFLAVVAHRPEPGRFTWLSRAKLPQKGNRSSGLLDERLAAAGWQVVYPETMSISTQMAQLAASERVAGEHGSALHMLLFLKNVDRLKVDIFDRSPDFRSLKSQNKNYQTIAVAKKIDQTVHRCSFERVISRRGAVVDKISENSFKYLDQLGVPRMSIVDRSAGTATPEARRHVPSPTVARLKELAQINAAKRYLEIGVADGRTFLHVDFDLKHAVDPKFRFDTRYHESERCKFFETTSDDFFLYFANMEVKYDIVFLDGLHTFEQTFRDFCSTQAHCHDRTIWLIDDVYPSDAFSALPREALSRKFRKLQHGSGKGPWHGDVFKTIFAIHDFFPNLSYRTVVGQGNPQAVVIRRPRKDFTPRFGSLETISRLSYFDFLEEQALLDVASDEELFAWLTG